MASGKQLLTGLIIIGAGLLGGYGTLKYVENQQNIEIEPLVNSDVSSLTINTGSPYNDKLLSLIAQHNRIFIVQPTKENKYWWDWSFKVKFLSFTESGIKLDPLFTDIRKSFSQTPITNETNKQESLNQACDVAYKADSTKFDDIDSSLLENISFFCSKGLRPFDLTEPFSITYKNETSFTDYNNGILNEESNREFLVKSKESSNQKWWNWAYKNLFETDKLEEYHSLFQHVTQGYAHNPVSSSTNNEIALNHACDNAYKKQNNELTADNNKLLENISVLCTISITKAPLFVPTSS